MSFLIFRQAFLSIILGAFVTACVSVNFSKSKTVRANEINFQEPTKPFQSVSSKELDHIWRHTSNGNTISFLSDCENPIDPPLEDIQKGLLAQIDKGTLLENRIVEFSGREGLHSLAEGNVDGIKSRMEFVLFKKHNCTFILTYLGVAKTFGENQKDFHNFLKGFEVP